MISPIDSVFRRYFELMGMVENDEIGVVGLGLIGGSMANYQGAYRAHCSGYGYY